MARMLGRSRSLRMLKGGHKETHQRETDSTTPQSTLSQVEVERLKAATPVSRTEGKVETAEMLQRPKTSGGPGDRSTLFHKKVTPLQPENQDFEFPFLEPNKSATVLYAAEVQEDREGIIGIALGSPTMASHWNTTSPGTDFVTNSQGTITQISSNNRSPNPFPQTIESYQEAPKPKLSRWKSLFKKTAPPPPPQEKDTFYQLAKSVTPARPPPRADSHHDDESIESQSIAQEDEWRAMSPQTYTYNPKIRESRKLPKGQPQPVADTRPRALTVGINSAKPKSSLLRSASSPKPPSKSPSKGVFSNSPTIPQLIVSGGSQVTSPRMNGDKPLLDVDIPTVHMERYSVMFSGLLQQNSNQSSNLLQRRQGNSEKLKPLNELSMKNEEYGSHLKPQRRATSPSFAPKSPGHLSLFPSANTSRAPSPRMPTVNRPRPLQRSKTAPASSPHRQSFPKHPDEVANASSQESKMSEGETADATTPSLSRTSSPSSERSFDSASEEITIVVARNPPGQSWNPRVEEKEPEWEIVSKKAPTNSITRQPSINNITKASALRSHPATDQPSSAPLESTSSARSPELGLSKSRTLLSPAPRSADRVPTESGVVGVARSLSVTRANKPELLKPGIIRTATDERLGAGRFVDSKPLTPTLVELKNRKSQRVQLVDA